MSEMQAREFKGKGKMDALSKAELTKPGLVFTPKVDIFENDLEFILLADMPGVGAEGVSIEFHEGQLTLTGEVAIEKSPEERDVSLEFEPGRYFRQLSFSKAIDEEKIEAKMAKGVLRLTLPKVDSDIPRKIHISSG